MRTGQCQHCRTVAWIQSESSAYEPYKNARFDGPKALFFIDTAGDESGRAEKRSCAIAIRRPHSCVYSRGASFRPNAEAYHSRQKVSLPANLH